MGEFYNKYEIVNAIGYLVSLGVVSERQTINIPSEITVEPIEGSENKVSVKEFYNKMGSKQNTSVETYSGVIKQMLENNYLKTKNKETGFSKELNTKQTIEKEKSQQRDGFKTDCEHNVNKNSEFVKVNKRTEISGKHNMNSKEKEETNNKSSKIREKQTNNDDIIIV